MKNISQSKFSFRHLEKSHSSPAAVESEDESTSNSTRPQGKMLVTRNGGFELQDADDYMAKRQATEANESERKTLDNREQTSSPRVTIAPLPNRESKDDDKSPRPSLPQRSALPSIRPKSSVGSTSKPEGKPPARPMR